MDRNSTIDRIEELGAILVPNSSLGLSLNYGIGAMEWQGAYHYRYWASGKTIDEVLSQMLSHMEKEAKEKTKELEHNTNRLKVLGY